MVSITFGFKTNPLCYVEVKEIQKKFDNSENRIAKQGPVGREGTGERTLWKGELQLKIGRILIT